MRRRDVLRWTAHGLAAAPLAAFAAACGNDEEPARGAAGSTLRRPTTTTTARPGSPGGPGSGKWWLEGNFGPVSREVESTRLEVTGAIPPELSGLYVRNGSNPVTGEVFGCSYQVPAYLSTS